MVCGDELVYSPKMQQLQCYYCDNKIETHTCCKSQHYVCDGCHSKDAVSIIKEVCLSSTEKDMTTLLKKIRSHSSFPLHGPEHHAMVAGIILTAYRNSSGDITDDDIILGIDRGSRIPGGFCGFQGSCGAGVGVGIAYAILLKSTPIKPEQRQKVIRIVSEVLRAISENKAARCCQRESLIALHEAARLSEEYLDIKLLASEGFKCTQYLRNKECIETACPFWHEK